MGKELLAGNTILIKGTKTKIFQNEHILFGKLSQYLQVGTGPFSLFQAAHESPCQLVVHLVASLTGCRAQGTAKKAFPNPGRTGNEDIPVVSHPGAVGEPQNGILVQVALGGEVKLLERCLIPEMGSLAQPLLLAVPPVVPLRINQMSQKLIGGKLRLKACLKSSLESPGHPVHAHFLHFCNGCLIADHKKILLVVVVFASNIFMVGRKQAQLALLGFLVVLLFQIL